MSYRELNSGTRPLALDFHTKQTASRLFRVDTRDPVAARAEVIAGEGGMSSPFPGEPALIVDSILVTEGDGGVTSDVTYNYSSDRRASLGPRVNKDRLNYYSFRESITSSDIEYPYALFETHRIPGAGTSTTQKLWTIHKDRKVVESRSQVWVNVAFLGWDMTKRNIVNSQVNILHNLGFAGVFYLFRGAEISQRTDSASAIYDVTYNWIGDPGSTAVSSLDADISLPTVDRPPFHEYIAKPGADPKINPPTYGIIKMFSETEDPDGWTLLPGMPGL